jgi:hypothetical protein
MYKIETRNRPRGKRVPDGDPDAGCVRIYKNSPQDLILQLWDGKRYMAVALFPHEARYIANELVAAADAVDGA